MKTQVCKGAGSGHGNGADVPFGCYQTLGDLWLDFGKSTPYEDYRRELDLERGVATVTYRQDGVRYRREVFASYPDRALTIHIAADRRGAVSLGASLNRPERFETRAEKDHLLMSGALKNGKGGDGLRYAARLKPVVKGGTVAFGPDSFGD